MSDHIDVIPAWAAKRDVATWAYLCRRYAADRREWKQRAREAEQEAERLRAELQRINNAPGAYACHRCLAMHHIAHRALGTE